MARLNHFIEYYVNINQTGFIPNRDIIDNIRKTINYCKTHCTNTCILSLDTEKAFDKAEPQFLKSVSSDMEFGPKFQTVISTLYHAQKTQVSVNSFDSREFQLFRGTHQGYPLSPLLFVLCVEPLANISVQLLLAVLCSKSAFSLALWFYTFQNLSLYCRNWDYYLMNLVFIPGYVSVILNLYYIQ